MAVLLSGILGTYVVGLIFVRKSGKEQMMEVCVLNWVQMAVGTERVQGVGRESSPSLKLLQKWLAGEFLVEGESCVPCGGGVGQAQGSGS